MDNETQSDGRVEFKQKLLDFTKKILHKIGFQCECEVRIIDEMLFLDFSGNDIDGLTANRSELLLALEYLLNKVFQAAVDQFGMINCDVLGKKQTRMAELKLIAFAAAEKVRETKLPFSFSPMDSRERRLIHLALADDQTIHTQSEGEGEQRKVVIFPA